MVAFKGNEGECTIINITPVYYRLDYSHYLISHDQHNMDITSGYISNVTANRSLKIKGSVTFSL